MTLLGHDEPWRLWHAAAGSARMPHAWILAGPVGVGKGAFARQAAAELVAEAGVAQPDPESHPDILVLDHPPATPEDAEKRAEGKPWNARRNVTVAQVRAMERRLVTRPTLGARRAVIIDPADDLEKEGANALLKSLEEPPQGTFFLLVTHRPGRLLPTIRSRCRMLRFAPLNDQQVDMIVARADPAADAATRAAAVEAARGSPGAALSFLDHHLAQPHDLMLRLLREGDPRFTLRGALAEEVGARPARERQLAMLDLARTTVAAEFAAAGPDRQLALTEAHRELVRLAALAPTYNFDAGLLVMEIGGLLASAALPREAAS